MKELKKPYYTVKDEGLYKSLLESNKSAEGKAIISFAETWAILLEGRTEKGEPFEIAAEATMQQALDIERGGITDVMCNMAVVFLFKVWVYGEQLKQWHNSKQGISDASGVMSSFTIGIR